MRDWSKHEGVGDGVWKIARGKRKNDSATKPEGRRCVKDVQASSSVKDRVHVLLLKLSCDINIIQSNN